MIGWFTVVLVSVATAAGALCVVLGLAGKKPNDYSIGAALLVEVLLIAQLVIAIVSLFAGNKPTGSPIEFFIYLIAAVIIPLIGGFWALVERDRWSTVILGVACLTIAVMVVRMNIIWSVQIA